MYRKLRNTLALRCRAWGHCRQASAWTLVIAFVGLPTAAVLAVDSELPTSAVAATEAAPEQEGEQQTESSGPQEVAATTEEQVEEVSPWGVEVLSVRSTAAGHMLEFRYRVVDGEKAAELFERSNRPLLTHKESGRVLVVPNTAKLGPLRNSNEPREGRIYWMFFGNTANTVERGDTVSVAIGDYHSDEITVE